MGKRITSVGTPKNLPLNVDPASKWRKASDWAKWKPELPNSYTYRARAVDATGKPLSIPRAKGTDARGLIYIGETGVKDDDSSERVANLAKGLATKSGTYSHNAAKRFWDDGWDAKLRAIDAGYILEIGWDEQVEETTFAMKDPTIPVAQHKDQTITNSGKGLSMKLEKDMLRQYENERGERAPINKGKPPGLRNTDRKTKRGVNQDLRDIGP